MKFLKGILSVCFVFGLALSGFASSSNDGENVEAVAPLIQNDAIVLGVLLTILALIFYTSSLNIFRTFYKYVPALLLCYFIPSLLNTAGIISGAHSNLYHVASRYLLPASLILLCIGIDFKGILKLRPKAIGMFLSGTLGIVIGGPIAIMIIGSVAPDLFNGTGEDSLWRGLSTVAGSWIGGGANQTAMREISEPSDDLFSAMVTVDIIVANFWMFFLLLGAGMSKKIDRWFKADSSAIEELKEKMETRAKKIAKVPTLTDLMMIAAIGLGGTAIAHWGSDMILPFFESIMDTLIEWRLTSFAKGFFWLVIIATTIGLLLSFTKMRNYEGAGASKIGSLFLYVLVATIGMEMDITEIFKSPWLFVIGLIWMLIHVIVLFIAAKLMKAPFFFVAVGSQANVGGAASAPVVASAFSPVLAPVGVLLAVFGYALGTYGAILCTWLMEIVST